MPLKRKSRENTSTGREIDTYKSNKGFILFCYPSKKDYQIFLYHYNYTTKIANCRLFTYTIINNCIN